MVFNTSRGDSNECKKAKDVVCNSRNPDDACFCSAGRSLPNSSTRRVLVTLFYIALGDICSGIRTHFVWVLSLGKAKRETLGLDVLRTLDTSRPSISLEVEAKVTGF